MPATKKIILMNYITSTKDNMWLIYALKVNNKIYTQVPNIHL